MQIKIIDDYEEVYENGEILSLDTLKKHYDEATWVDTEDEKGIAWDGWSDEEIVKFITDAWGIQYEIIQ